MFSEVQFVSIWLQVGSSLPKLATSWLKEAASWLEGAQVATSIAQVGANMVSKGPSWRQNAFMAAQVHAKVALGESKLAPIWAKLSSRQLKVILSCP